MDNPVKKSPPPPAGDTENTDVKAPRLRRRLGVLLVIFIALAAWFGWTVVRTARQSRVVKKIESVGGYVVYNYDGGRSATPKGPRVVRKVLGDQYFVTLTSAHLRKWRMNEADLADIAAGLQKVGVVDLYLDGLDFGEGLIEPLKPLTRVKRLFIKDRDLTPTGLKQIEEALPNTKVIRR